MTAPTGPWRVGADGFTIEFEGADGYVYFVGRVDNANDGPKVAAAPEMYEALCAMVQWVEEEDQERLFTSSLLMAFHDAARAALAKAEGK